MRSNASASVAVVIRFRIIEFVAVSDDTKTSSSARIAPVSFSRIS